MIPVALTQGVRAGAADRPAPNRALENVAEELLNGMFCTYEPPPPPSSASSAAEGRRHKKRGILRASKLVRRPRSDLSAGTKSVRWVDTHDEEDEEEEEGEGEVAGASGTAQPHLGFHCNVACLDANIGAGCFAPTGSGADAAAKRPATATKPSGKKKLGEEIVFDEEGHPQSLLSGAGVGAPSPPPPPPPPRQTREPYLPQLCGVKMNCGGDDDEEAEEVEHRRISARSSRDGPSKTYHRPRQDYDYEDDMDNSLIDEEEDEVAAIDSRLKQQHQAILKKRMQTLREKQASHRRTKKINSGTKDESDWDEDRASNVSGSSSLFRRVFTKKGVRNENVPSASRGHSSNRSLSAHQDATLDPIHVVQAGGDTRKSRAAASAGDWDESIAIVPGKSSQQAQSEKKSTRHYRQSGVPSPASRSNESITRDPSPGIVRTRSRSLDDNEKSKGSRWTLSSKNKSSSRRSKSPNRSRSSSPSHRVRSVGMNMQTRPLSEKELANFNYMHPTYRQRRNPDDRMERESMITAHRHGMDKPASVVSGMDGDQLERQSYITAHRDGFSDIGLASSISNGTIHPLTQSGYRNYDDMLERQSYITASRQNFDEIPRSRSCGLFNVMEEDHRDKSLSKPSTQKPGQSLEGLAEAKARERIRRSLEALPDVSPAFPPLENLHQNSGACFPQQCLPEARRNQSVAPPHPGIDRSLQARQQAQLQRQYYERIRAQQPKSKASAHKARTKGNTRPQRLSLPLPFLRRSRSSGLSRSRSASPSRPNTARRRSRSLDFTEAHAHSRVRSGDPRLKPHQQVLPPVVSSAETKRIVEEPPASEHKKEMTWEERTQQAWERLRSGTIFETTNDETSAGEKVLTQVPGSSQDASAPKSFFQSAMAMLSTSTVTKDDDLTKDRHTSAYLQMPANQQMSVPNQFSLSPMMRKNGIVRQSSFDKRRVTFGGRTEQIYDTDGFSHLVSPQKRKVFKGTKIITGLFGRTKTDRKYLKSLKQQSMGLQQTHTRSTDLSSCPSTHWLSEEWNGGCAGPKNTASMVPFIPSIMDKSIVDGGCLDPLSHLRQQAHRLKDGPQDPSGPIAY